jgi:hypothetical protein
MKQGKELMFSVTSPSFGKPTISETFKVSLSIAVDYNSNICVTLFQGSGIILCCGHPLYWFYYFNYSMIFKVGKSIIIRND